MFNQTTGFILGILSMTLYGLYMVPRKKSKVSQKAYTFWMGCGILLGTTAIGLVGGIPKVGFHQYSLMLISGIVWATGTLAYSSAVKYIGLSRSTPLKNISAVLGTLIGILLFHEFTTKHPMATAMVIGGSLLVVVSATMLARVGSFDEVTDSTHSSPNTLYGILTALWAAIAYSAYTIPMKIAYSQGISPSAFLYFMGHGCFIGMTLLAAMLKGPMHKENVPWKDRNLAGLSGLMWAVGSLSTNVAIKLIGVAVAWPLAKSTVVAVLYGTYVLHEVDAKRNRRDLNWGLLLSVVGILLLALAMR